MNYYYRDSQGHEVGPLPSTALSQLRQSGLLSDSSLVRSETDPDWVEYVKAMGELPPNQTSMKLTGGVSSAPSPKTDRLARARKFSWLLFVFAGLCFLLPFAVMTNRQPPVIYSGIRLILGESGQAPNASLVLGLALIAIVLALRRKPFGIFLSALAGFLGIAALLMLESSLEQAAVLGEETISIQEGLWLSLALFASGAVVQMILFKDARTKEAWRFCGRHYITLACLALSVGIFYPASVAFDSVANVTPTKQEVVAEVMSRMPYDFSRFKLVSADLKFDQTGERATGVAHITLALKEPLYAPDDFAQRAIGKGDDPEAYAQALTLRNELPPDLAPPMANSQASALFAVAKPEGSQISIDVNFSASKVPRQWSFADALNNWLKRRQWTPEKIDWPPLSNEFAAVSPRAELPRGAMILADDSTQRALQYYVDSRRAFIASVAKAENSRAKQIIERAVADAAHTDIEQNFRPASAYSQPVVKVEFPEGDLTGGTARTFDASIVVEQTVDLYRLAKEQPAQWPEFQPGSPYEMARAAANRYLPQTRVPGSANTRAYEIAFPAHTKITGTVQIDLKGANTAPVLSKIQWNGRNGDGVEPLFTSQNAGQDAIFVSTDPNLPSVDAYRAKLQAFVDEISKPKPESAWKSLPLNMVLVWIPPGTFTKGVSAEEKASTLKIAGGSSDTAFQDEIPQSKVTLTKGFWMAQYLVTQAEWQNVMGTTLVQQRDKANTLLASLLFSKTGGMPLGGEGPDFPMHYVSWDEAMEFCRKLTDEEHAAGLLADDYEYTLPTDAQWEYACRAGTSTWFYSGDVSSNFNDIEWCAVNSANSTHPVGQKQPNAWGLYDMLGNVWEWCLDWYAPNVGGSFTDPTGPATGTERSLRGGSFMQPAIIDHSAERNHFAPAQRGQDLGFRIVLVAKP